MISLIGPSLYNLLLFIKLMNELVVRGDQIKVRWQQIKSEKYIDYSQNSNNQIGLFCINITLLAN